MQYTTLYANYISIKHAYVISAYVYICGCIHPLFLRVNSKTITKLKDKHISKTSDSYCQIPKTSDKAHLHHWQERQSAGVRTSVTRAECGRLP